MNAVKNQKKPTLNSSKGHQLFNYGHAIEYEAGAIHQSSKVEVCQRK